MSRDPTCYVLYKKRKEKKKKPGICLVEVQYGVGGGVPLQDHVEVYLTPEVLATGRFNIDYS